jgi:hypothetical protein
MPARQMLSGLCDAVKQSSHSAIDQRHIAELYAHCMETQDSDIMRKTWGASQGPDRTATDVMLANYSQTLETRLLMPMTHTPE